MSYGDEEVRCVLEGNFDSDTQLDGKPTRSCHGCGNT